MNIEPFVATASTPPPPYWERIEGAEAALVEFSESGKLYHIEDPTGQNRRLVEGWTSLNGADWEDEDVPSHVFLGAIEEYYRKNPVILWDHQRDKPIGELLEWEITDQGLFVRFRIYDSRDFDNPNSAMLALCNDKWSLVRRGLIRGLSWDGRARKRWIWSADLGKMIKQPIEILMSEITVTPIQVHPGAKITGCNTLSKALRITKALRLRGGATTGANAMPMTPEQQAAFDAQQAYVAALKALPEGVEPPAEVITNQEAITKALGLKQPPAQPPVAPAQPAIPADIMEAITKALAPTMSLVEQHTAAIAAISNQAAPLRNQVAHDDNPVGQPRPNAGAPDMYERMTKALDMGGQIRGGKLERGQGEAAMIGGPELMKMHMAINGMKLSWNGRQPDITWSDSAKALMARVQ